jgi:hypothetical protein
VGAVLRHFLFLRYGSSEGVLGAGVTGHTMSLLSIVVGIAWWVLLFSKQHSFQFFDTEFKGADQVSLGGDHLVFELNVLFESLRDCRPTPLLNKKNGYRNEIDAERLKILSFCSTFL